MARALARLVVSSALAVLGVCLGCTSATTTQADAETGIANERPTDARRASSPSDLTVPSVRDGAGAAPDASDAGATLGDTGRSGGRGDGAHGGDLDAGAEAGTDADADSGDSADALVDTGDAPHDGELPPPDGPVDAVDDGAAPGEDTDASDAVEPGDDGATPADGALCTPYSEGAATVLGMPAPVYASWVGGYCEHFCLLLEAECTPQDVAVDVEACEAICRDDLKAHPEKIPNYHCQQGCLEDLACIEAPPIEVPDVCAAMCQAVLACGLNEFFDVGASETPQSCALLCAGGLQKMDDPSWMQCVADHLVASSCDPLSVLPCYDVKGDQCFEVCEHVNGHDEPCPADSPYGAVWQDGESCEADCLALSVEWATALHACAEAAECWGFDACWPVPDEVDPACPALCDEILATCPDFPYPSKPLCETWCTLVGPLIDGFPALSAIPGCPEQAPGVLPADPQCQAVCDVLSCCGFEDDSKTCAAQCVQGLAGAQAAEFAAALTCATSAGPSCDALAACLWGSGASGP